MSTPSSEWSKLTEKQMVELLDKLIRKELFHELRFLLLFMQQMEERVGNPDPQSFNQAEELFGSKLLDMAKKLKEIICFTNR